MDKTLLVCGLIFPALSWLTFIAGWLQYVFSRKRSSGIYIPFIGPILIDIWLLKVGAPFWTTAIPWFADIGTIFFLVAIPRLLKEEWRLSKFTRLFRLVGGEKNQSVEISFHEGGYYLMRKTWRRASNEAGIVSLGEVGKYVMNDAAVVLTSETGWKRTCRKEGDNFRVEDTESSENHRIHDWNLRREHHQ